MFDDFTGRFQHELNSLILSEEGRHHKCLRELSVDSFEALSDVSFNARMGDTVGALKAYTTVQDHLRSISILTLAEVEGAVRNTASQMQGKPISGVVRDGMVRGFKTLLTVARRQDRLATAILI